MKRMKKKVVAMVTLAMFVMTLLPMAAFAANPKFNHEQTVVELKDGNASVEVGDQEVIKVEAKDINGNVISSTADNELYVWFESEDGVVYDAVTFVDGVQASIDGNNAAKYGGALTSFTAKFNAPGTYVLKAGVSANLKAVDSVKDLTPIAIDTNADTVTVDQKNIPVKEVSGVAEDVISVEAQNGIQKTKVDVTVKGDVDIPVGTVVKVNNNDAWRGIKVVDAKGKEITEVKVTSQESGSPHKNGKAEFYVVADKGTAAGVYNIELVCNDVTGVAPVEVADVAKDREAVSIEAVPVDGVLAADSLTDKVQFVLKNKAGEVLTSTKYQPVIDGDNGDFKKADYVEIVKQPRKGALTESDIKLVRVTEKGNDNWALDFNGKGKNLKAGEYVIELTLKNGEKATTTFNVDNFDKAVELEIVPVEEDNNKIVLDGKATEFKVVAIDKNGLKKDLNTSEYNVGFVPVAKDVNIAITGEKEVSATLKNGADKNDVLGTKVTLGAMTDDNLSAKAEFTIVDKSQLADNELVFDKTEGTVLKNNVVKPTIVNKETQKKALNIDKLYVKVLSQSNPQAKVAVSDDDKNITIYSNKDTSVDVQVIALSGKDAIYSATLTYTVGEKVVDPNADTLVALTIGSKDMIVNNKVVSIDAAPYVNKDYRTMVPLSAITEAFGVTPEWNEKDRTVTVEMNGTKIVMTIDKKTYTLNGEEKTMNTAPVIVNSRTMVPVRFIAEDLGFTVAPIMSDKGLTEGVVISK